MKITLGVIALAVMFALVSGVPAWLSRPVYLANLEVISARAMDIGRDAEVLARALYDGDQTTAGQVAASLNGKTERLLNAPPAPASCLNEVYALERAYYGELYHASLLIIGTLRSKEWEQLITAGNMLLSAEDASRDLLTAIYQLEPASCS